jgi:predicted nucleotide-binding protein (sugar kinase/HSP70/actin superfamily)
MMGNYIESIEKGADTIIITGSCGPCRFGEYCELQMRLLKKLGYDVNIIVLDAPSAIGKDVFLERIKSIARQSPLSGAQKMLALKTAVSILNIADRLDAKASRLAGYEASSGECKRLLNKGKSQAFDCRKAAEIKKALKQYEQKLNAVEIDPSKDPVKIALVGEIYSMIEPFGSLFLREKLMDYGVSTVCDMTTSWWIKDLVLKPMKLNSRYVQRMSQPYLPYSVGGHARESIAHALRAKNEGFDGVIQVYPLGCMPEIIAKSVLPGVQQDGDLPVMTLVIDEITGEAGYDTRIEAFIDMLYAKKRKKVKGLGQSLQLRY